MSEHTIQSNFFNWVLRNRAKSPNPELQKAMNLCYANQTGARMAGQTAQKMKMEGMTAGIPDVNLDWSTEVEEENYWGDTVTVDDCCGLRLEFKYRKSPISAKIQAEIDTGSYLVDLSPEQKDKRLLLIEAGYEYQIVYSVTQAVKVVMDYLPFDETDYIKPKYL